LHCDARDPAAATREYGYDVCADIETLGLAEQVRLTRGMSVERGLPLDSLATIYQAADVHLLSSTGEGFGLPTLQAAAAGVVPMAGDYTASHELTHGHGETIRISRFLFDEFGLRRGLIDVEDAVAKLARLYADRDRLRSKQIASRRFAQTYDWPNVISSWDALLREAVRRYRPQLRAARTAHWTSWLPDADNASPMHSAASRDKPVAGLPQGVRATVQVVERRAGEFAADIVRDAARSDRALTIPVTLPSFQRDLAPSRRPGSVYLASDADVPAFIALARVFPGLRAWSTRPLPSGIPREADRVADTPDHTGSARDYDHRLAASILALDSTNADPALPENAAAAGVVCVSLRTNAAAAALWDEVAIIPSAEPRTILATVRPALTDQSENERLCAAARQRLQAFRCTPESV
jgi:hypothetical protein